MLTQDKALKLVFPGARIERKTIFLTEGQSGQIERDAKAKAQSRLVSYYVGRSTTGILGYAFFETHTVRTMPETFMAVVGPDGRIKMVELLAFYEPEDYRPHPRWLKIFEGRDLTGDQLWVKRGIRNIAGATLTAQAIAEGVRRILATYRMIMTNENKKSSLNSP